MATYFHLTSGPNDHSLKWPCPWQQATIALMDQQSDIRQQMNMHRMVTTDPSKKSSDGKRQVEEARRATHSVLYTLKGFYDGDIGVMKFTCVSQALSTTGTIPGRWALKWLCLMAATTIEAPALERVASSPTAGLRAETSSKEMMPSFSSVWRVRSQSDIKRDQVITILRRWSSLLWNPTVVVCSSPDISGLLVSQPLLRSEVHADASRMKAADEGASQGTAKNMTVVTAVAGSLAAVVLVVSILIGRRIMRKRQEGERAVIIQDMQANVSQDLISTAVISLIIQAATLIDVLCHCRSIRPRICQLLSPLSDVCTVQKRKAHFKCLVVPTPLHVNKMSLQHACSNLLFPPSQPQLPLSEWFTVNQWKNLIWGLLDEGQSR